MIPTLIIRNLGSLFLDGPWQAGALLDRATHTLGRRETWLKALVESVLTRFTKRPSRQQIEQFLRDDDDFFTICQRDSQRWKQLTGVVVNDRPNCPRANYDPLKAILFNCVRYGPASQNRTGVADFRAHLVGRIAHLSQLNGPRGKRLRALFEQIDWSR
jgi:hypothetical protein